MDPAQLVRAIKHARLSNSIAFGVISIWGYDYLSALPLEVEFIWKSQWGVIKSIFLFARMVFPIQVVFASFYVHSKALTASQCHTFFVLNCMIGIVHAFLGEAVIFLQVWALSQRNRLLGAFLVLLFMAFLIATLVLQGLFIKSMGFITLHFEGFHCIPYKLTNQLAGATYNLGIACESVLVLITLWIAWSKYRHSKSALLGSLLRDGLLYMHGIVLLSVATTVISYRAPDTLKFILGQPKAAITHILFTRLVLHLRSAAARDVHHGDGFEERDTALNSSIHFASRPRGRNPHAQSESIRTAITMHEDKPLRL